MTKRKIPRQKTLPATLDVRVINDDLKDAVCGSPTKCAIAHALARIEPKPTFVSVKENRITITWNRMLHHYELTRQALKLVALNDCRATFPQTLHHQRADERWPEPRRRPRIVGDAPARRPIAGVQRDVR